MGYMSFESADEFISTYKPDRGDIIVMDWMIPGLQECDLLEESDKTSACNYMGACHVLIHSGRSGQATQYQGFHQILEVRACL